MIKKLLILLLLACCLTIPAFAGETLPELRTIYDYASVEKALPKEAEAIFGDLSVSTTGETPELGMEVFHRIREDSRDIIRQGMVWAAEILMIVLLSATLHSLDVSAADRATELAAVLAIGTIGLGRVSGIFFRVIQSVDSMSLFATALYPALAAATAASGRAGTASALYGGTMLLCGGMTQVLNRIFLPAVSCYGALLVADAAVGDGGLKTLAELLRQLLTTGLKALVLVFTSYLTLTGVIHGNADAAAIRAAKLTISTAVPVVGSMVADASESLLVGAGLLRSGIGIFGLLGIGAVTIVPFLEAGIPYLILKATSAAAAMTGESRLSGLIGGMASAMGLVAALTGVCGLILMIGCVCFMQASIGG